MTQTHILTGLLILIFTGCGQVRIDMISEHSGLKLPADYKVIKNTTESTAFAGADFEINIILEFENKSLIDLKRQTDSLLLANPKWTQKGSIIEYSNKINRAESESIMIDLQTGKLIFIFFHI